MNTKEKDFLAIKVLIVDDNVVNRNILSIYCKKRHIKYETAIDGIDAYEKAQKCNYDIIFMDIQMPRCDGPTSVKMIREYENKKNQKKNSLIIMLTGLSADEMKERSMEVGADEYHVKPVSMKVLDCIIKTLT